MNNNLQDTGVLDDNLTPKQTVEMLKEIGNAVWTELSLCQKIAAVSVVATTIPMAITVSMITHPMRVTRNWVRKAWNWTKAA